MDLYRKTQTFDNRPSDFKPRSKSRQNRKSANKPQRVYVKEFKKHGTNISDLTKHKSTKVPTINSRSSSLVEFTENLDEKTSGEIIEKEPLRRNFVRKIDKNNYHYSDIKNRCFPTHKKKELDLSNIPIFITDE